MTIKEELKSLNILPGELKRRFCEPIQSVTFWMHLIVAVIGFGGAGLWYALRVDPSWPNIAASLCTYFPAVAGAAFVDSSSEDQPFVRSFAILVIAGFAFLFFLSVSGIKDGQVLWGIVGSVSSILFWWVVNADKSCFRDVDGDGSTPNPNRKLKGNKKGWRV